VKIAGGSEDFHHPLVELHLAWQLAVFHFQEAEPEQLEPLDWIDRMHSPLEWKVDIVHVQQEERLLD